MNEMSKCAEMNYLCFDSIYFPKEDLNIEIWVLKATVWNLLLRSIVLPIHQPPKPERTEKIIQDNAT